MKTQIQSLYQWNNPIIKALITQSQGGGRVFKQLSEGYLPRIIPKSFYSTLSYKCYTRENVPNLHQRRIFPHNLTQ